MAKRHRKDEPAMAEVRRLWEQKQAEGLTMHQLGVAMGYPEESARKSVSQFLKSRSPQMSVLRRFAKAMGVAIEALIPDQGVKWTPLSRPKKCFP